MNVRARTAPGGRRRSIQASYSFCSLVIAVSVAVMLMVGMLMVGLSVPWFVAWLLPVNAVTFGLYRWDKRCAIRREFRVPELTLHALAFVGGTVGAFAGQHKKPRHKTGKTSFQVVFWLTAVLQTGLVGWFLVSRYR